MPAPIPAPTPATQPAAHRCARLVAWGHAVSAGLASPDLAAEEVVATDPPHRVVAVGDVSTLAGDSLPVVMARWAASPTRTELRLLLPDAGDPVGLGGGGPFAAAALEVGQAVLVTVGDRSSGLVPRAAATQVRWVAYDGVSGGSPLPGAQSLAEADRALAEALREATDLMTGLDLARYDPSSAEAVAALRSGRLDGDGLAPGYPDRAVRVLVRARRLRTIVALARAGDGAAVTAAEATARVEALRPLDRAARHAEMAAYNWPQEQAGADPTAASEPAASEGSSDRQR